MTFPPNSMTNALSLTRQGMPAAAALWTDFVRGGRCSCAFVAALLLTAGAEDSIAIFSALAAGVAYKALKSLNGWLSNGVALEANAGQVWAMEIHNRLARLRSS